MGQNSAPCNLWGGLQRDPWRGSDGLPSLPTNIWCLDISSSQLLQKYSYLTTFWDPNMSKSTWIQHLLMRTSTDGLEHSELESGLVDTSWCIWHESQLVTGPVRWSPDFYFIPDGRRKAYKVRAGFCALCRICLEMVSGAHPSLLGWLIVIRYKVNTFI